MIIRFQSSQLVQIDPSCSLELVDIYSYTWRTHLNKGELKLVKLCNSKLRIIFLLPRNKESLKKTLLVG